MKPGDRLRLTAALRTHVSRIAADLRGKMQAGGHVRERAMALHRDEQVGEDFEVWTDLLSRRAAVLWVLKSVYVRVLEDRGLLSPGRLLDLEAQELFEKLAPNLGETAFLRWVFRDLASHQGGLPELFGQQPAELVCPSDALSRELLRFWRHEDPDTGARWSFTEERFEGELMGDLYQELDPVVKDRYALCQTPDFVRGFILDRTLTPALETFDADEVRLLDPACGSGHFLIDGLKRLVAATGDQHPDWDQHALVTHCLQQVVGIDLNDYACALARARLVMTAAELAGVATLKEAAQFHPHVYWADGLEQVERDQEVAGPMRDLFDASRDEPARAVMTRPEIRGILGRVLKDGFHAVVANPPYITEKDPGRKAYHRQKMGRSRRYISAYREYSLAAPFTERCLQLARQEGYVGLIVSNNFMKREFGKPLIEQVLPETDLTLVVDTSQAYIPFHGTPTVLLFSRSRRPQGETVRAVMGKRGEVSTPDDPAKGQVWSSIVAGWDTVGFENEFVSVADVPREILARHPWSLGGGGALEIKGHLERVASATLGSLGVDIGRTTHTGMDQVFYLDPAHARRVSEFQRYVPLVKGEDVRDWSIQPGDMCLFPYDKETAIPVPPKGLIETSHFWHYRTSLRSRSDYGEGIEARGLHWFEHSMFFPNRFLNPLSIAFAFVATHNHFVLDRGGKVFKQSAPVIKLPAGATEEEHLALLGLLNSSTACFWMKQVFHNKGSASGDTIRREAWEPFFEFDATKMRLFPVPDKAKAVVPYTSKIDELARGRASQSVDAVLGVETWSSASALKELLAQRRSADLDVLYTMVALQEELDWVCYRLYGIETELDVATPDAIEPIPANWLPWTHLLAALDESVRGTPRADSSSLELPTDWFHRHGWDPLTDLPEDSPRSLRDRVNARRDRILGNPALALVESPVYKRRWYRPDYQGEEQKALTAWLAGRVEEVVAERAHAINLEQVVAALQDDRRLLAVAEVLAGRRDFSLSQLVWDALTNNAVPHHSSHVYKQTGLEKRAVWERTWADQRREDAGEAVTPAVPPSYTQADFLRVEYYRLRGKLDVPKERFIAFTEVPGRSGTETLYGWAGWTPLQRVRAILAMDEDLEDAGVPLADRVGLLDSAWRLLPDVEREDPDAAGRLKAELQALVGAEGPSREMIEDWQARFPPPGGSGRRRKK